MNNAVAEHIREQVKELTNSIQMLEIEVSQTANLHAQKVRRLQEKTLLRDELKKLVTNVPDHKAQSAGSWEMSA